MREGGWISGDRSGHPPDRTDGVPHWVRCEAEYTVREGRWPKGTTLKELEKYPNLEAMMRGCVSEWPLLRAELRQLIEEFRAQLHDWAVDALEDVNGWGAYADDYFQEKWGYAKDLDKWTKRVEATR